VDEIGEHLGESLLQLVVVRRELAHAFQHFPRGAQLAVHGPQRLRVIVQQRCPLHARCAPNKVIFFVLIFLVLLAVPIFLREILEEASIVCLLYQLQLHLGLCLGAGVAAVGERL